MIKKSHEQLGRSIDEYIDPTYIEELRKDGRIKIWERKFIDTTDFHIDLENNIVRRFIDGTKSEEVFTQFLNSFNDEGWNPHKGPICVVIKQTVDGVDKYRPMGYTHRGRATVESNISNIPSLIISIVDDINPNTKEEAIIDLYTLEQSYERAIVLPDTKEDVEHTLQQYKNIYTQRFPNWKTQSITKLETYLEDKIVQMWKKPVTNSFKNKIADLLGDISTYSVRNYNTYTIANNFINFHYNGNYEWNGIGKVTKNFTFSRNRTNTPAIELIENDKTKYHPIFIYDGERNSGWMTTYDMLIKLYEDKSTSKLMVFFGIGGGDIPTNTIVDSRRKVWTEKWDLWVKHLPSYLKDYLNVGGWLASDTDMDKFSILDYNEVRRNNK